MTLEQINLFLQLMTTIQMLDHPLQTIFTDRVVVSGRILERLKGTQIGLGHGAFRILKRLGSKDYER